MYGRYLSRSNIEAVAHKGVYDKWLVTVCPVFNCFDDECKKPYYDLNPHAPRLR